MYIDYTATDFSYFNRVKQTRISIIIPCLNEVEGIRATLNAAGAHSDLVEIIVVDGGSTDDTCEIVSQIPSVKLMHSPIKSRAVQMNIGAHEATGDILLFLHADTILPNGFEHHIMDSCTDDKVVGGAFYLRFNAQHWMLGIMSFITRLNIKWITVGDHAMFFKRELFERLGGYPEIPLLEDLEFQLNARKHGKMVRIQVPVITSARRFISNGVARQIFRDAYILLAYYLGRSPKKLAKLYR